MTTTNLKQIAITVSDVELALSFYRDILGLQFLFSPAPQLAFLTDGNIRFMLSQPQGAGAVGANSICYFSVSHIQTTYERLVAAGAAAEREPALAAKMPDHDLWIGFLGDPDGNLVMEAGLVVALRSAARRRMRRILPCYRGGVALSIAESTLLGRFVDGLPVEGPATG